MGRIDLSKWTENEDGSYSRRRASVEVEDEVEATDAAVELAEELGVDLASVEGTGVGGRVTVGDVRAAADA